MSTSQPDGGPTAAGRVAEIVIVDPSCDRYADFVRAAQDEQRALASGVAGFLVRPLTLSITRISRQHAADNATAGTERTCS